MTDYFYGMHAIESILTHNPHTVIELFLAKSTKNSTPNERFNRLIALAEDAGITVQYTKREQLDVWAQGQHQGVVARCKRDMPANESRFLTQLDAKLDNNEPVLLLILDGVTDPQNLGVCLRSADALGVDAIIMPKDKSAAVTPAAVKIASGASETVPLYLVTNLARCIEQLKSRGIWVYGTAISDTATELSQVKFARSCALVMGAEGRGMRQLTMKSCDELVYLPMQGHVDSLNVGVAASVFLYAMRYTKA